MMLILKKLKNILLYDIINNAYKLLIILISFIFVIYNFNFISLIFILFIIYLYFKKNLRLLIYSIIIFLLILIQILIYHINYNLTIDRYKNNNQINNTYKVNNVSFKENYQLILLKDRNFYLNLYLYDDKINYNIIPGSIVYIKGIIEIPSKNYLEYTFSYFNYLKENKIIGIIKQENIKIIENTFSINIIAYNIKKYYDNNFSISSSSYLKALIIGDKTSLDSSLKDNINKIGISHLFVVSGLHVSIFVIIISKLTNLMHIKEKYSDIITIIILFIYLFITNILISVFRVFLSQILKFLNKDKQINTFNLFSINVIISMIIFPNKILSYSFILTYLISGVIILSKKILEEKSKFIQSLLISIISIFITLPIIININGEINLLSIIYNIFYIPFVSYLIIPLSLIVSILPFLKTIYEVIINLFNSSINYLGSLNSGIIIFPMFSFFFILIYYFILYLVLYYFELKNTKRTMYCILVFIIFLFIYQNKIIFNLDKEINFLNLEIGDATFIKYPANTCNIIIDTGENEEILLYLKKRGIKRIDYLIISHGDSDHNYMLKDLIKTFNVKNVIISSYDNISLRYLNETKKRVNLIKIKGYNEIKTKYFNLTLYNPLVNNQDINDNSLVFKLDLNDLSILFTGDASINIEKDIIKKYNNINVDILKVAHHGSNTSSSVEFLNSIKFKLAVAMNGYNNTYGFPHKNVINRFSNKILLNTIDEGTIKFKKKIYQKHYIFKSYKI